MNDPDHPTQPELLGLLQQTRTVAVLGASSRPDRPANYVPSYLHERGFHILPVNPQRKGEELFGEPIVSSLAELDKPVDLVDVFRRSEDLPSHLDDILALDPPPKTVWFQLGIRNDEVADALRATGIVVVQDRCLMVDHRRLFASAAATPDAER